MFIVVSSDIQALERKLLSLPKAAGENLTSTEFLGEIRDYQRKQWVTNFNLGGVLYGGWKRLDPDSEKGARLLYDTGALYGYLQDKARTPAITSTGMAGSVAWSFGGDDGNAKFIAPSEKMVIHQFGTGNGDPSPTPARKMVGFNAKDRAKVRQMVAAQARKFVSIYV